MEQKQSGGGDRVERCCLLGTLRRRTALMDRWTLWLMDVEFLICGFLYLVRNEPGLLSKNWSCSNSKVLAAFTCRCTLVPIFADLSSYFNGSSFLQASSLFFPTVNPQFMHWTAGQGGGRNRCWPQPIDLQPRANQNAILNMMIVSSSIYQETGKHKVSRGHSLKANYSWDPFRVSSLLYYTYCVWL